MAKHRYKVRFALHNAANVVVLHPSLTQQAVRTRTTRSKGRPLADPEQNTQLLTEQLRSLGLYAAHTLGDGNCLFRALSDQLYGSPSCHLQLRKDICDWIGTHSQRYEPFCEDERGLTAHLRCMREQGTYGGHLELSAFSHFARRNVKVIQPGLVYVIEWHAGAEVILDQSTCSAGVAEGHLLDAREKRRLRKHQQREDISQQEGASDTVYVAYHDWEHFSSIRNLRGPHTGLPNVCELSVDSEAVVPSPVKKKPLSRTKSKQASKGAYKRSKNGQFTSTRVKIEETMVATPTQIPLPMSRSPSSLSSSESLPQIDVDVLPPTPVTPQPVNVDSALPPILRVHRSPKRTFDESSGSSSVSDFIAKRTRSASVHNLSPPRAQLRPDPNAIEVDDPEEEESTPELSTPRSSGSPSSSVASSPLPGTPPPEPEPDPMPIERPLTRRQCKALGLPKPRAALVAKRTSAGKIVVPGGRFKRDVGTTDDKESAKIRATGDASVDDEGSVQEEWQRNGTGRLDVRGFRELKI